MSDAPPTANADDAGPLRIGLALERFDPDTGGAERSTAQIAEALAHRGHEVTVLAVVVPRVIYEAQHPYRLERLCGGGRVRPHTLLLGRHRLSRRLDAGDFDAIVSMTTSFPGHVVEPRAGLTAGFQQSRVMRRRSPIRRALKRVEIALSLKQQLLRAMEKRTLADPRLRRVVAVSAMIAEELREVAGVSGERVVEIPNGSVSPDLPPEEKTEVREALRRGLSLDDAAPLVVFAAHDPGRKGGAELMRAWAQVIARRPEARLACIGGGSYALHRLAVEHDVRPSVLLLGPTRHAIDLFAAADALVLPTWYDPASKVVIESLMVGTPAVTTRLNGSAQFVAPGSDAGHEQPRGRVIDTPADTDALADAMLAMCDREEQRRCAARCHGLRDQLTMDRHVDRLEALLREVVAERRGVEAIEREHGETVQRQDAKAPRRQAEEKEDRTG